MQDSYMKMLRRYDLKRTHNNLTLAANLNRIQNRYFAEMAKKKPPFDRNEAIIVQRNYRKVRGGEYIMKVRAG